MLGVLSKLFRHRASFRPAALLLAALSLAPVTYVGNELVSNARDIAYWDELDTAIQLVIHLNDQPGIGDFANHVFALANEHRMATSRLIFAASYWLTGTINFAVIGFIGNAWLVLFCLLLLHAAGTPERRVKLGLILAMLFFQFQHYENLLWSGASIDHFQVVLLAGGTVIGIARGTRVGLLAAAVCALLATFTLAHGILTWFVAAAMLWQARRFPHLKIWGAIAIVAIGGFLAGFQVNHAQRFADLSAGGALVVLHYWLVALGSLPALGNTALAPWLAVGLLALLGWLAKRGAARTETVAFPLVCFAIAALALIAVGRAAESNGVVHSRYYVLGAVAWGLVFFMLLEQLPAPRLRHAITLGIAPVLVAFNVAANRTSAAKVDSWYECRDLAAARFIEHGADGRGPFMLHPAPWHSTQLLNEAEKRGVYRLGTLCEERVFSDPVESGRIAYHVESVSVNSRAASVVGWAAIPGLRAKRGDLHLVLRSDKALHVFTMPTTTRPDVAAALNQPTALKSGFYFARRRDRLPEGEFQIGFLIKRNRHAEYTMTAHRLRLVGEGEAMLASAK